MSSKRKRELLGLVMATAGWIIIGDVKTVVGVLLVAYGLTIFWSEPS